MEIEGTIVQVLPLQGGVSKSGNQWSKATVIIETPGQYPKKVAMTNMKNAEEFSKLPVGTYGKFSIDVESREYQGRWYNEIRCYHYDVSGAQAAAAPQTQVPPMSQFAQPTQQPYQQPQSFDENLPF